MAKKLMDKVLGFIGFEEEPEEEPVETLAESPLVKKKSTVVSLHAQRQVKVVVAEPRTFEEVQEIVDNLKNRRPVIVNLERVDGDLARRIVDFVSGATYGLNGSMQKVGGGIFLFVPSNIDIAGETQDVERGLFSWIRS
ncbi:MAG: Cell division protein sepF [Clostridia bacterium 62_21]|nr:MAG: Cell division protein sepF [Clostridia bacterium 62_21]